MSDGTNRLATRRRSREEIIELFRACAAKLNRTPGKAEFERTCGISETDIRRHFWKSGYTELAEAAGLPPNTLTQRFEDDQVFEDYAKICLHIGRIPSEVQLRGATRELGTKTWSVKSRFPGGTAEFQERFRQWLATQPLELQGGSPQELRMGSVRICRLREQNLSFTHSSRHRYNIWTCLLVVIARRSIRATNRYPPSLSVEPQTRFAASVSRFLNLVKVRAGTPMHWLSLRGNALLSS